MTILTRSATKTASADKENCESSLVTEIDRLTLSPSSTLPSTLEPRTKGKYHSKAVTSAESPNPASATPRRPGASSRMPSTPAKSSRTPRKSQTSARKPKDTVRKSGKEKGRSSSVHGSNKEVKEFISCSESESLQEPVSCVSDGAQPRPHQERRRSARLSAKSAGAKRDKTGGEPNVLNGTPARLNAERRRSARLSAKKTENEIESGRTIVGAAKGNLSKGIAIVRKTARKAIGKKK